jgi:hypothetical protein
LGGHGGVQPLGHAVEVGFQLGDLVAAGHRHALLVVAVGDLDGGGGQPSQPADQPAGGQQPEDQPHRHGPRQH